MGVVDENRISYYRILEGDPVRGSLEFVVSDLGFVLEKLLGNQLPAYGQAWALTHFLFNNRFDQLIKFYASLQKLEFPPETTHKVKGDMLLKTFNEAFGDRVTLELEWRRYMRQLKTHREQFAGDTR